MKTLPKFLLLASLASLASCENPISQETKVRADGSLEKTITFERTDTAVLQQNFFNIGRDRGWAATVEELPQSKNEKEERYRVRFVKSFASTDEMNGELNTGADTLFNVRSNFQTRFRWFFTTVRYSETYLPLNRFTDIAYEDFFTPEDFQFIQRLPADGVPLPKADSVYLQVLNDKIDDHFVRMAVCREETEILKKLIRESRLEDRWIDSVDKYRSYLYEQVDEMKGDQRFALKMADSLHLPLPKNATELADAISRNFNNRLKFMSYARDGKYQAIFEMPWTVVSSNADSVAGNRVYWRPSAHKFVFTEYELYAEVRKVNGILTAITAVAALLVVVFWIRRKRN